MSRSAPSKFLCSSSVRCRFVDPASSSPSKITFRFTAKGIFFALSASIAASSATIGDLSSEDERAQMRRVLLDVWRVARNVGDGKEFLQLAHDAVLVVYPVVAHFLRHFPRAWRSRLLRGCGTWQQSKQGNNRSISQSPSPRASNLCLTGIRERNEIREFLAGRS